jgi:hypothetical protein
MNRNACPLYGSGADNGGWSPGNRTTTNSRFLLDTPRGSGENPANFSPRRAGSAQGETVGPCGALGENDAVLAGLDSSVYQPRMQRAWQLDPRKRDVPGGLPLLRRPAAQCAAAPGAATHAAAAADRLSPAPRDALVRPAGQCVGSAGIVSFRVSASGKTNRGQKKGGRWGCRPRGGGHGGRELYEDVFLSFLVLLRAGASSG